MTLALVRETEDDDLRHPFLANDSLRVIWGSETAAPVDQHTVDSPFGEDPDGAHSKDFLVFNPRFQRGDPFRRTDE